MKKLKSEKQKKAELGCITKKLGGCQMAASGPEGIQARRRYMDR